MEFDDGIYPKFVESRMANLVSHFGAKYFDGITVLEAGCGYGYAGELLETIGAVVTSLDARKEHIEVVKKRYPKREALVADLNKDEIEGAYDFILAIGLLYHLEEPERFIWQCCRSCDTLCISTIVCDSPVPMLEELPCDKTFDQGVTAKSYVPSPTWICKTLDSNDFSSMDISSNLANVAGNRFDWKEKGDGEISRDGYYLRRMYVGECIE